MLTSISDANTATANVVPCVEPVSTVGSISEVQQNDAMESLGFEAEALPISFATVIVPVVDGRDRLTRA